MWLHFVLCVLVGVVWANEEFPNAVGYTSDRFNIQHWSGKKWVRVKHGNKNPDNNRRLTVNSQRTENTQWYFKQVTGHWGFLTHARSGKVWRPQGGKLDYSKDTKNAVVHKLTSSGTLVAYNDEHKFFVFRDNKRKLCPRHGKTNPGNAAELVWTVKSFPDDVCRFEIFDLKNRRMSIYPKPLASGRWVLVNAVINPGADHTTTYTYRVGKSVRESVTNVITWSFSVSDTKELFNANFEQSVSTTREQTWTREVTYTKTIHVKEGNSVYSWHWVFELSQWGDVLRYGSTITHDTNTNEVPESLK